MNTPVGPYTPVVRAGEWVITSGQIGLGPDGLAEGFAAQLRQALANLRDQLESTGARLDQVVKTTVFLTAMSNYQVLNELYTAFFDEHAAGHRPARSAVAVAELPIGALVEIEAVAYLG